jgi:hypothetical protein
MSEPGDPSEASEPVAVGVADEVRAIIGATMRLADAIRGDAERRAEQRLREADEEARRYLEDARREAQELLSTERRRTVLAERIVEQSGAVASELAAVTRARRELDEALSSLEASLGRISEAASEGDAQPGVAAEAHGDRPAPRLRHATPESPVADRTVRDDPGSGLSGARLVAAQMARAGSSRAEVAAHLQRTFELTALHEILDEVFDDRETRTDSTDRATR